MEVFDVIIVVRLKLTRFAEEFAQDLELLIHLLRRLKLTRFAEEFALMIGWIADKARSASN